MAVRVAPELAMAIGAAHIETEAGGSVRVQHGSIPMSAFADDYPARLTLAEQVARIEQMNGETAKLAAEARKFAAEQGKLAAEQAKLSSDRVWLPWQVIATGITAAAAVAGATAALMTVFR